MARKKAYKWYLIAAEGGDEEGMLGVADYYSTLGINYRYKNPQQADYWYKKGLSIYLKLAENNNSSAFFWLGYMYENGEGVEKDYQTALSYYNRAAEAGFDCAEYIEEIIKKIEEENQNAGTKNVEQ